MTEGEKNEDFMVGSINVSPQHNLIKKGENSCKLQPKAMAVFHYLFKNKTRVINNEELLEHVWHGRVVTNSSIQKCVNALRVAFAELDGSHEYIAYFSKQGYQLITPASIKATSPKNNTYYWLIALIAIITLSVAYFSYLTFSKTKPGKPNLENTILFSQVSPYISNTGHEILIEPHAESARVALIRNKKTPADSRLLIHGIDGDEWEVFVARGNFNLLAWSISGRNLVATDFHIENQNSLSSNDQRKQKAYTTFHIFTLDFKGNKVIEKNTFSHWLGEVSSVSWWDENTIEFTASRVGQHQVTRYRYSIADQKLTQLSSPNDLGVLVSSHIFNKKTAVLSLIDSKPHIQFLDKNQHRLSKWPLPFNVNSLSWNSDGLGVLLLSNENKLSMLYTTGALHKVNYSPQIQGSVNYVRSKNEGKDIVITVTSPTNNNSSETENTSNPSSSHSPNRFMENGGGYIYHSKQSNF